MFHTISITGFIVVFAGIIIHCFISLVGKKQSRHLSDIPKKKYGLIGILRILVYLLTLFCFGLLVFTGFYQPLVLGVHISGYLLMLHATFAPVFAVCLAVLAVMWAHNCQLDKNYWPWLQRILRRQAISSAAVEKYELTRKVCFWLIMVLALPVILSLVLSMLHLFGTHGQESLMDVHRYSTLLLSLIAIIHIYLTVRTQIEK